MQHIRDRTRRIYQTLVALHEHPFIAGQPARNGAPAIEPKPWFRRCFRVAVMAIQGRISQRVFDEAIVLHMRSPELRESLCLGPEAFLGEYRGSNGVFRTLRPPWILL